MTEAFLCDFCQEFHTGEVELELYKKEHIDRQGTDHVKVADLCEQCSDKLESEMPLIDEEE